VLTTQPARGTKRYWVRKIVLATGGTDRPRRLNIPGEDLPHVSHYFQDPHTYFRQKLLIVGGKNSAVEAALRCQQAGAEVSLSYRRAALPEKSIKYWLMPEIRTLMESGRIATYFQTIPTRIAPGEVTLSRLDGQGDGATQTIEADFVLLLIGYEQEPTLLRLAGVDLTGPCAAPAHDQQTMETNVPGIYVAGTATGGTQERYTVFIENCHVHVQRILASLTGSATPAAPAPIALPES